MRLLKKMSSSEPSSWLDVSDTVNEPNAGAVTGRAWSHEKKTWFDLSPSPATGSGKWTWTSDRGWFQTPETPEGDHELGDPWFNSKPASDRSWNNDRGGEEDEPPEWDGKSIHRTTYFRKIEIWETTTRMSLDRRGPKLLGQLTG